MTPLIVCDFDGVLVDLDLDTEAVRARIKDLFAAENIRGDWKPLLVSLDSACAEVALRDPVRSQDLRRHAWAIIDAEELRCADRCQLRPGAQAFLDRVADVPCAIFSNNHRAAIERAFARTGVDFTRFHGIVGRTGPSSIKPSAQPVLDLLDALASTEAQGKRPIERIVLIGDHPYDMQSATQASAELAKRGDQRAVVAIGLPKTRSGATKLEQAGAWFIAADLDEAARLALAPRSPHAVSMVYLAFNEQASIPLAIADARRFGQTYLRDYEIVVVDDGSSDATAEIATREAAAKDDVRVVRHDRNRGMGAAMRSGYQAATKSYMAHLPADRQVRAQALLPFLALASPACVVTSHYAHAHSGSRRQILSWAFRFLVVEFGGLTIDFSGTYLFHRDWLEKAPLRDVGSDTFLFSFEILQRFAEQGAHFQNVMIHPFPRVDGISREVALRRIFRVAREMARYRLRRLCAKT